MNVRETLAPPAGGPEAQGSWLGSHPAVAAIRAWQRELTVIRRELHANPELGFEEHFTSEVIARQLARWGVDEVHRGIGRTGVVGVIRGRDTHSARTVGLRTSAPVTSLLAVHAASNHAAASGYSNGVSSVWSARSSVASDWAADSVS